MSGLINEIGNRYGKLIVLEDAGNIKGVHKWKCKCDCGNFVVVAGVKLRSGHTKSCGCLKNEIGSTLSKNEIGNKYGNLTVINCGGTDNGYMSWICKCDCGNIVKVRGSNLRNGNTTSCGCYQKENPPRLTHGKTNNRIYKIWSCMKTRCSNPNSNRHESYLDKGIKICEDWLIFENFYEWSINNGYKYNFSIDRIDNNGNYEPSNCRWADSETQSNNKSNNHVLTYNNESLTVTQGERKFGLYRGKINKYLKKHTEQKFFNKYYNITNNKGEQNNNEKN